MRLPFFASEASRAWAVAFVAAAACASNVVAGSDKLRGVDPKNAELYQPDSSGKWSCLTSKEKIDWKHVNDDYCDCKDGSDEPGTSACPNGVFYCANEGHLPATLASNRVNDGICDPECCDGSDEYDGKVKCPNKCAEVGREWRKKQQEEENKRRAGAKIRAKYIVDGKKAMEGLEADIARLEVEVEVAQEKERRLKEELKRAEDQDQEVIANKKGSNIYGTLVDHQGALKALLERERKLRTEMHALTRLLDDLASGYNPNNQDMAVKGAVVAYKEWKRGGVAVSSEEGAEAADSEPIKLNQLMEEGDWPRDRIQRLAYQDPLELLDDASFRSDGSRSASKEPSGILFRIHEYLPDPLVPYFEATVDTLLDLLIKANIITDVKKATARRVSDDGWGQNEEAPGVIAARRAHQEAERELKKLTDDLDAKYQDAAVEPARWGREGEFKAIAGTCVDKDMGEYTYELCFFERTTQKPNKGGGSVMLGQWAHFNPANSSVTPQEDEYYLRQLYDRGQRVWNAGDRITIVDLACGTKNELLNVFEAEVGKYSMQATTPAVCFPPSAGAEAKEGQSGSHVKEEL